MVVQRLRLHPPDAGGLGLIPSQGTRFHRPQLRAHISHITCHNEDPACCN